MTEREKRKKRERKGTEGRKERKSEKGGEKIERRKGEGFLRNIERGRNRTEKIERASLKKEEKGNGKNLHNCIHEK